jgi:hypothetical protein
MTTVTRQVRFEQRGKRVRAVVGPVPAPATGDGVGRVPRVARLMALAIRFDQLLRDGVVSNQTELARLARVTQPRMTQIMNLLHLAPDIQEAVLARPPTFDGHDPVNERALRPIISMQLWRKQRAAWAALTPPALPSTAPSP